jgi:hypothetical protein
MMSWWQGMKGRQHLVPGSPSSPALVQGVAQEVTLVTVSLHQEL